MRRDRQPKEEIDNQGKIQITKGRERKLGEEKDNQGEEIEIKEEEIDN